MKVLHIIPRLKVGGAENLLASLLPLLKKEVGEQQILIFDDTDALFAADFVVEKKKKLDIGFLFRLRKKIKEIQPDIVHTHLFGADVWGKLAARSLGIPVITTEHGINESDEWYRNVMRKWVCKEGDIYVACSKFVKNYVKGYCKNKAQVKVIYNGVNKLKTNKNKRKKPVFAFVGRLVKQKQVHQAIKAFEPFEKEGKLFIFGEGPEKEKLQKVSKSKSIEFKGIEKNKNKIYPKIDAIIISGKNEGLSLVALEAFASKTFVFAHNSGGLKEIIKEKKTGLLFKDEKELQKKIAWYLKNTEKVKKQVEDAYLSYQKHFALKGQAKKYKKIYESTLSK